MLFNSVEFCFFFPIVTILYFMLPHKARWALLLIASCFFYMYFIPKYILILFGTITIDYFSGIMIERAQGRRRKLFLLLSLIANISVLVVFKYYNFFISTSSTLYKSLPHLNMLLPIGLSFHTFQAMSYTIEVYRGNEKAERHFGIYSLYVMFYPQLVAGPIERPQNMLHQFHERKYFKYEDVASGLRLMLWGLIKKIVIADRLATYTDPVFNNPHGYGPLALTIGAVFFAFQIYCDFSGYSDIAIGSARVMGYRLMTNFNVPYHSRTISEFWKRWHISLSTWFKDYVYIPLGGNRCSKIINLRNVFIVFLLSGFWHGANYTFIIWGALHGFYTVFAMLTQKYRAGFRLKNVLLDNTINKITVFILVTVAWVFFRANTVSDAVYILTKISHLRIYDLTPLLHRNTGGFVSPLNLNHIIFCIMLLFTLEIANTLQLTRNVRERFAGYPVWLRWGAYYAGIFMIIFLGVFEHHSFIYFQF